MQATSINSTIKVRHATQSGKNDCEIVINASSFALLVDYLHINIPRGVLNCLSTLSKIPMLDNEVIDINHSLNVDGVLQRFYFGRRTNKDMERAWFDNGLKRRTNDFEVFWKQIECHTHRFSFLYRHAFKVL